MAISLGVLIKKHNIHKCEIFEEFCAIKSRVFFREYCIEIVSRPKVLHAGLMFLLAMQIAVCCLEQFGSFLQTRLVQLCFRAFLHALVAAISAFPKFFPSRFSSFRMASCPKYVAGNKWFLILAEDA